MSRSFNTLVFAATALASCASEASAANPIIGRWHLVSWQPNTNPNWLAAVCSDVDLVFTPTTVTRSASQANFVVAASYNVQPDKVVVSSANDVIYLMIDAQHMQQDDMGKCTYQRVG